MKIVKANEKIEINKKKCMSALDLHTREICIHQTVIFILWYFYTAVCFAFLKIFFD